MKGDRKRKIDQGKERCPVCMERSVNCNLDGCMHNFCFRCISKWSKRKNTCPICRKEFKKLRCRNKVIEVKGIEPLQPPRRMPIQPFQQRRIIYVPFLIYPHNPCLIYNSRQNIMMNTMPMPPPTANINFNLPPAFFIPQY